MMKETILAVLIGLPPAVDSTETAAERSARLETVAAAIESASLEATCKGPYSGAHWCRPVWSGRREDLAALLVTQGWWESKFADRIGAGRCRSFECDALVLRDGRVIHRSRHYWQLQTSSFVPAYLWSQLVGTEYEPTTLAAYAAAIVLGEGLKRCGSVTGAISFYAGGGKCSWNGGASRVAMFRAVKSKL
jgi:hypothetical protein